MKLYKIRNWDALYENNRTRELKKLDWFPMPNKQDGDGYTAIMEHKDGAAILGAFIACVQIASRCDPRGTLARDGQKPHSASSLSRMSRIPEALVQRALDVLSGDEVNWLEIIEVTTNPAAGCEIPAPACEIPAPKCLEGKGREGNEGKGNGADAPVCPSFKFSKPTVEELKLQADKIGLPHTEVEKFLNHYESVGWKVGKSLMKSWPHSLAGWKTRWEERIYSNNPVRNRQQSGNL